jgi:phosphoglycerate dehydrogenase-like enzyme
MPKQQENASFRVGVTRDFLNPDGQIGFGDIGLSRLDDVPGISWEFLPENCTALTPAHAAAYDALLVLAPRVTSDTLAGSPRLSLVARFGVGYDNIDVDACTKGGVALTITPDGVRRPVAVAVLTFLLALSHKLLAKDRLTREGRWADKLNFMGQGLTGRTLGVIGLGNIGREIFRLTAPLEMRHLASDPFVKPADVTGSGIALVELETLLREADFVVVTCALTESTRHLLNTQRLALMKPTAYLINIARGPIVDQAALTTALRERRIAGAGLDVFEQEPIDPQDPLLSLDNVILAPHALCWTDECFAGIGRAAIASILDVAAGRVPKSVVNRAVLESSQFQGKLRRRTAAGNGGSNGI